MKRINEIFVLAFELQRKQFAAKFNIFGFIIMQIVPEICHIEPVVAFLKPVSVVAIYIYTR